MRNYTGSDVALENSSKRNIDKEFPIIRNKLRKVWRNRQMCKV